MKYDVDELKEFTSDKPVVFEPPKRMVVWDDDVSPRVEEVVAFLGKIRWDPVVTVIANFKHCAEIPDETTNPRRATNRELAKWLAQGNGQRFGDNDFAATSTFATFPEDEDAPVEGQRVRKWDDTEWREPTVEYMFGNEA